MSLGRMPLHVDSCIAALPHTVVDCDYSLHQQRLAEFNGVTGEVPGWPAAEVGQPQCPMVSGVWEKPVCTSDVL